jgi:hypothetical protein
LVVSRPRLVPARLPWISILSIVRIPTGLSWISILSIVGVPTGLPLVSVLSRTSIPTGLPRISILSRIGLPTGLPLVSVLSGRRPLSRLVPWEPIPRIGSVSAGGIYVSSGIAGGLHGIKSSLINLGWLFIPGASPWSNAPLFSVSVLGLSFGFSSRFLLLLQSKSLESFHNGWDMILWVIFNPYNLIANFGKPLLILYHDWGISGELIKVHSPSRDRQVMQIPETLVSSGMHWHSCCLFPSRGEDRGSLRRSPGSLMRFGGSHVSHGWRESLQPVGIRVNNRFLRSNFTLGKGLLSSCCFL